MTSSPDTYDFDYFERGPETGKSLYQDYRWMPWPTAVMAHAIIEAFALEAGARVLDVGCAKGFLVRALRFFDMEAEGCDVSRYAVENADPQVMRHVHFADERFWGRSSTYDLVVCKDVLEHLDHPPDLLRPCARRGRRLFVAVPVGDGEHFTIPEYDRDVTHVCAQPAEWWVRTVEKSGWRVTRHDFHFPGVKEHWQAVHPRGNYFILAERAA